MLRVRPLLRFFVLLTVFTTVLLYPWSEVARGYSAWFRTLGNTTFARYLFWPEGRARFLDFASPTLRADIDAVTPFQFPPRARIRKPKGAHDTLMILTNRNVPNAAGQLGVSSRILGYWPTAFLLALILAKPLAWKRKAWAVLWGMVLVHAFVLMRVSLLLTRRGFGDGQAHALFEPGETTVTVLRGLERVLVDNPTVSFIVPVFIWLLVSVTRAEWTRFRSAILGGAAPEEPSGS